MYLGPLLRFSTSDIHITGISIARSEWKKNKKQKTHHHVVAYKVRNTGQKKKSKKPNEKFHSIPKELSKLAELWGNIYCITQYCVPSTSRKVNLP